MDDVFTKMDPARASALRALASFYNNQDVYRRRADSQAQQQQVINQGLTPTAGTEELQGAVGYMGAPDSMQDQLMRALAIEKARRQLYGAPGALSLVSQ